MSASLTSARKRPVNITLSEALLAQTKPYTTNLSATIEALLTEFVANQRKAQVVRQKMAARCAADWNDVTEAAGSFADEHSTL